MKIYDENQFTKNKLDERERILGLEDINDNSVSLTKSCTFMRNIINHLINKCEKLDTTHLVLKNENIKGVKIIDGDFIVKEEKSSYVNEQTTYTRIYLGIESFDSKKNIFDKYFTPKYQKEYRKRMEQFFKIDKSKGELLNFSLDFSEHRYSNDYSDTFHNSVSLDYIELNILKCNK